MIWYQRLLIYDLIKSKEVDRREIHWYLSRRLLNMRILWIEREKEREVKQVDREKQGVVKWVREWERCPCRFLLDTTAQFLSTYAIFFNFKQTFTHNWLLIQPFFCEAVTMPPPNWYCTFSFKSHVSSYLDVQETRTRDESLRWQRLLSGLELNCVVLTPYYKLQPHPHHTAVTITWRITLLQLSPQHQLSHDDTGVVCDVVLSFYREKLFIWQP